MRAAAIVGDDAPAFDALIEDSWVRSAPVQAAGGAQPRLAAERPFGP